MRFRSLPCGDGDSGDKWNPEDYTNPGKIVTCVVKAIRQDPRAADVRLRVALDLLDLFRPSARTIDPGSEIELLRESLTSLPFRCSSREIDLTTTSTHVHTSMPFFKKFRRFSRHKKLCEEWALANSRECVEGSGSAAATHEESEDASEARFILKYLGSTLVETPSSEEATAEAIKTVITMAKASGKKLQRVSLAVSLKGIRMTDIATEEDQLQVSIYRISYCSADATHDHVFAFIATNLNETMECHAFLCPKRKMAQTVTLTVAQAFNTAYEAWQLSQADPRIHHVQDKSPSLSEDRTEDEEKKKKKEKEDIEEESKPAQKVTDQTKRSDQRSTGNGSQKNLLIDLTNEGKPAGNSWVCFEDESEHGKALKKTTSGSGAIPMTTLRHTSTASSHHVVPRPATAFKMQNAWGESRSVDLMCS